jgi:hypothetical protein
MTDVIHDGCENEKLEVATDVSLQKGQSRREEDTLPRDHRHAVESAAAFAFRVFLARLQTRLCCPQSSFWHSREQYPTSRHWTHI